MVVDVAEFFPLIWEHSHRCAMPDCTHDHEPDCAVKEAVARGGIPPARYESYLSLMHSIEELRAPRDTDVDRPWEQVKKSRRRVSRRAGKQQRRRIVEQELLGLDEPEEEPEQ